MRAAQDNPAQSLPRVTYAPRGDTSQEAEATALCAVYKFVLDCRAKTEAAPESRPDDAERNLSDSASNHSTA
jgi:hypothetical protein